MREVLRAAADAVQQGIACVYCTLIETRGSTPQKAGAAMAIFRHGGQVGTLGGGCVEAEVRARSLQLIEGNEPAIFTFLLDDDYGWDDGLICGGRMTFVAQPLSAAHLPDYFRTLLDLLESGSGCTEAIVASADEARMPAGARLLFDADGAEIARYHLDAFASNVAQAAGRLAKRPRPRLQNGIAYLPVLPRCPLLVVGAGHVGQAVARLAHTVDFDVLVADDRESFANAERFPMAHSLLVGDLGHVLKDFEPNPNTYGLIITRGHSHDEEALYRLVCKPFRYLGMIGSRRKIRLIFDDLLKENIPRAALDRVYAPLGIDIGSQTVPEIAVSIVAQLVGHRNLGPDAFPPPSHAMV